MTSTKEAVQRWGLGLAVLAVVMVVVAGCGGGSSEPDRSWSVFQSQEGRFRVALPGEPARREQALGEEALESRLVSFTTQLDDVTTLDVSYADYPATITEIDPRLVLTGAVTGAVERASGTLARQTPLTAEGSPAVDYVIDGDEGWLQARAILVANRLYLLQLAAPRPDAAAFEALVTSFELL